MSCREPDSEWVEIREIHADARDGDRRSGATLRWATEHLGGYVGTMPHPETGTVHEIDLRQFESRDPDATKVAIRFCYVDPTKVGTKRV